MARKNLLLGVITALLMSACTDDVEQGAVTVTAAGVLRVLHHPCSSDNVVRTLRLMVPVGPVVGDGDDVELWKVVAVANSTSASVETFEPRNLPASYRETIPLDTPAQGEEVAIYLETRHGSTGLMTFVWGALKPGRLLTDDGLKSRSEWLSYAIEGCGGT